MDTSDRSGIDPRAPEFLKAVPGSPAGERPDRRVQPVRRLVEGRRSAERYVRIAGTSMVLVSTTVLGWAAWEVVGSDMAAARHQQALEQQFAAAAANPARGDDRSETPAGLVDDGSVVPAFVFDEGTPDLPMVAVLPSMPITGSSSVSPSPSGAPPAGPQLFESGEVGALAGMLRIPAIDLEVFVSFGTDSETLKSGPGVWEWGVVPGNPGNATVSGHRTTYGAPFRHLDALAYGDRIFFDTPGRGTSVFEVRGTAVVLPTDVEVSDQTDGVRLTLTTCTPVGSAAERLIIQAELVEGAFIDLAVPADRWSFQGA